MPNRPKGARLYLRSRPGRDPVWVILDTGQPERSTGTADRRQAEAILAAHIADRTRSRSGPADPENMTVAEVLTLYGEGHAPHTQTPERIGYALDPLLSFWSSLKVAAIAGNTCRRYAAERGAAPGTIRRELGTLRAALNWCAAEGYLTRAPIVTLPAKPAPKDRWLSVPEAALFLRVNRRTDRLARFILLGLYTGTRKEAIMALAWEPHPGGGWIDLERGVLHRRGEDEAETKKRRPPARLPGKLLVHARRWREDGSRWVIHDDGQRVGSMKTAWNTARHRATAAAEAAGMDWSFGDVTPHTLRHTAITWAMHRGVRLADASGYFGISSAELERTYLHHHPDFQKETAGAMDRRKA